MPKINIVPTGWCSLFNLFLFDFFVKDIKKHLYCKWVWKEWGRKQKKPDKRKHLHLQSLCTRSLPKYGSYKFFLWWASASWWRHDVDDDVYQCNDGDDDDDGVNSEPEQDDGISSNFLHRPPLPCPQLATTDLSIKANSNKSKRCWILVLLTRVYSVTPLSTSRLPSEECCMEVNLFGRKLFPWNAKSWY